MRGRLIRITMQIFKSIDSFKVASFNCNEVPSKLSVNACLCESADLLLLQETWLLPVDQNLLDSVSSEFCSF